MSATARNQVFSAVHTVGGLLPADMLVRISEGKDVSGSKPADYRVIGARSVRDDAERHWSYLKSIWVELREKLPVAREADVPADPTGLARGQWLEPLFSELGFGSLTMVGASEIGSDDGSKTFAISHRWNHVPIHLTPWNAKLDTRPAPGTVPPQSLVQECLNRSDAHLWAVLSNGRQLRLLRDSNALATASYVEFDLEAIFDGELFSEFVLLYRLLHVSRFEVAQGAVLSTCWLEKWRLEAIASGTRALDHLRDGVQQAITTFGTGFLRHPANTKLREDLDVQAFHNALLRLVYRMLFLFVAEDRDVLHPKDTDEHARERYAKYFSTARLRVHARRRRGTAHSDLYQALTLVQDALGDESGRSELGLPGLGGIFNGRLGGAPSDSADEPLQGLSLSNEYLLTAIRHLAQVRDPSTRRWRSVDYRNLGAEELGSIYESLLELVPKHSAVDRSFELVELAGNSRKTTGSYYTPSPLIECLLDSALDPVVDDAVKRGEQAASAAGHPDPSNDIINALLLLTICDPACGSGHFLVAAARRIAKRVAAVREHNPEPTLDAVRHALHEVIARCIYGVDLNPMAIELAKVSLWMEGLEPGKPLSFLDAHIKRGNALIGATPALLKTGIPDEAFTATEGDDPKYAKALEKLNTQERRRQFSLFDKDGAVNIANTAFAQQMRQIITAAADHLRDVRGQAAAYGRWGTAPQYVNALQLADAWCAAFMWMKTKSAPPPVTDAVFRALEDPASTTVPTATIEEIGKLRRQYNFFHWHLEFPDVFAVPDSGQDVSVLTGWSGGFDCVLGNPPWDSVELKEREFFARRVPSIAAVSRADTRKSMIAALRGDPATEAVYQEYTFAKRAVYAESHFLRRSGHLPLTGQGNLNTYAVFSETARILTGPRGRSGIIVPTGIATDARTQYFFKDLVQNGSLAALYDFENAAPLFPGVHRSFKFAILSLAGRELREPAAKFAFFLHDPTELDNAEKAFTLTPEEINLLNPNTGTCPIFRSRRDAELTLSVYRRTPILIKTDPSGTNSSNAWQVSLMRMFDISHDAALFHEKQDLEEKGWTLSGNSFVRGGAAMLPLQEGRMGHQYNHRFADSMGDRETTESQLKDPEFVVQAQYWVTAHDAAERQRRRHFGCLTGMLGHRRVARNNDDRTCIATILPFGAASYGWILTTGPSAADLVLLEAVFNSTIYDYILRNSFSQPSIPQGTTQQTPVPEPSTLRRHYHFIKARVLELSYTANDLAPFARDLNDTGPPFMWDAARRPIIRAELDALLFQIYGILRDDVEYILDTFPIVKRKDEAKYDTYRTRDLILAEYDRMTAAGVSLDNPLVDGDNYTSTLNPSPGHGPRHPAK